MDSEIGSQCYSSGNDESQLAINRLEDRLDQLEKALVSQAAKQPDTNRLNLLVFDGSRDKLLAAFVMATGGAACGMEVTMFFTFWGTASLRKGGGPIGKKSLVERAFGMMLPGSPNKTKLSQMDMCGMGRLLMDKEMQKKNIASLDELIATAADLGVAIRVCEMSTNLMGIRREELIDYPDLDFCGVAKFLDDAATANTTLFI